MDGRPSLLHRHGYGVQESEVPPPPDLATATGGAPARARYAGGWVEDEMHATEEAPATFTYARGAVERYVGAYLHGKKHGRGTLHLRDGIHAMTATWEHGVLHGDFVVEATEIAEGSDEPALRVEGTFERGERVSATVVSGPARR